MSKPYIDQKTAKEWFNYDPTTGALTWRKAPCNSVKVGQDAGRVKKDTSGKKYRQIRLKGYTDANAHRVIWIWVTGHRFSDKEQIDHEDGDGINNRWKNLRLVYGASEQARNVRLSVANTSGAVGVFFDKRVKKYRVRIRVNGKIYSRGYFPRFEDAVKARKRADKEFDFHPNHGARRPL